MFRVYIPPVYWYRTCIHYEAIMLLWVLTLTGFGHLQAGVTASVIPNVDIGYVHSSGTGYYKVHTQAKTWDDARSICQSEGGNLAVINSKKESIVIAKLVEASIQRTGSHDSNYVLIGINDRDWKDHDIANKYDISVEQKFDASRLNESNNTDIERNCGSIFRRGQLIVASCDDHYPFVCERPEYEGQIQIELQEPIKLKILNTEFIVAGTEIDLDCKVYGYPTPTVRWYKDGSLIEPNDRINVTGKKRLIISKAERNDTGKYRCEAANRYMRDEHTVNIVVIVPVKVDVAVNQGPFTAGSEIRIACNAAGYPSPRILWYRGNDIVQTNSRIQISKENELVISAVEKSDTGKYRCEATNGYTSAAHTVDINVAVAEKLDISSALIKGYTYTPGIGYHKLHNEAKSWAEARSVCKEEGGDLAIINSEQEAEAIMELVRSSPRSLSSADKNWALIGFTILKVAPFYVTIEGETLSQAGYSKWAPGEPNGGGFDLCGSVGLTGLLNDASCTSEYAFICELPY